MSRIDDAIRQIENQQTKIKTESAPWYVGEQLKEIASESEQIGDLLACDLTNPDMDIVHAEMQIKSYADKFHKKNGGNCAFVPPNTADGILRKFYGLPAKSSPAAKAASAPTAGPTVPDRLNLDSFFEIGG